MTQQMTVVDGSTGEIVDAAVGHLRQLNDERRDLLKNTVAQGTTDDEFALFVEVCRTTGLNPFARQIYAVKRWDSQSQGERMTIQTGIDGFRLIAQRTGEYEGQSGPQWLNQRGEWQDYWADETPPRAARVGVWRRGFREPVWGVARFDSYKQTTKNGDMTAMWRRMGDLMIAKCAEALALRRAFPQELSGIYSDDEMDQASRDEQPRRRTATNDSQPQRQPARTSGRIDWNKFWGTARSLGYDQRATHELAGVETIANWSEAQVAALIEKMRTAGPPARAQEAAGNGRPRPEPARARPEASRPARPAEGTPCALCGDREATRFVNGDPSCFSCATKAEEPASALKPGTSCELGYEEHPATRLVDGHALCDEHNFNGFVAASEAK